jgi:hypothetical protein
MQPFRSSTGEPSKQGVCQTGRRELHHYPSRVPGAATGCAPPISRTRVRRNQRDSAHRGGAMRDLRANPE